ncbi:hypothetical protein ACFSVJ_27175 [Prauserella oleivorans]
MTAIAEAPAAAESGLDRATRAARRGRIAYLLSVGWIGLLLLLAAAADVVSPADPGAPAGPPRLPAFADLGHLLGTDSIGRDVLSRLVHGIRISLVVGLGATAIAVVLGVLCGLLAAYFRGWVETVVNLLTDTMLSFPRCSSCSHWRRCSPQVCRPCS